MGEEKEEEKGVGLEAVSKRKGGILSRQEEPGCELPLRDFRMLSLTSPNPNSDTVAFGRNT